MKPGRHLSSGSGSGSGDSHDSSSDDNGNQHSYSYYGQNTNSTVTFVACDLCFNGAYPLKPRKKVSSWPTITCKAIYYDLQSLNKHANPTQCYSKANEYRVACCSESTTSRQSRSHFSLPHPKFSTLFGIFIIWFIAREYVKSRRRLRDGEDFDDSSIPPEEEADYKDMGVEENGKDSPQKLMKLGSKSSRRKRSSSGRRGRSRRDDYDDDDSNASPVLSIIQMLMSTPQHKQRNRRSRRGRSRRRSRSRSASRSRSRGRRSKSRPIVLAEPDPPQMQLV